MRSSRCRCTHQQACGFEWCRQLAAPAFAAAHLRIAPSLTAQKPAGRLGVEQHPQCDLQLIRDRLLCLGLVGDKVDNIGSLYG
jgi:hypothetical protein